MPPAARAVHAPTISARAPAYRPFSARARAARAAFGRRSRPASAESCRLAVRLESGRFEVPAAAIVAPGRGPAGAARARQAAIYLAHVALGVPLTAIAAEFKRDRTTAAHACRQVEDRRDDPAFDVALADLELAAQIAVIRDQADPA